MNIGMILENSYTNDPRVIREAEVLARNGYRVYILSYNDNKSLLYEDINNIKVFRFNFPKLLFKKLRGISADLPFYNKLWKSKIERFILENNISVLHVHDLPLMTLSINIARKMKIKVVGDFHENYSEAIKMYYWANTFLGKILINKKKWEFLQKDCVKKLDRIIVVADETINYFSEKYKVAQEKFTVVDNSIDIEQFEKSGINQQLDEELKTKYKDNVVFGYTGGVLPNRGLQHFIKILPLFKQTNIKMVIVGKGRFSRVLKNMISQYKIDNMVDWYDWQPFQNLITFTSNFDVGITRLEKNLQNDYTTPNKVFQYMYMKIPVLTADSLPMLRIVGKTESGLVFKSENYTELKECVKTLIDNKQLREKMGTNGRKAVLEKYNWEETSIDLMKLYSKIKVK